MAYPGYEGPSFPIVVTSVDGEQRPYTNIPGQRTFGYAHTPEPVETLSRLINRLSIQGARAYGHHTLPNGLFPPPTRGPDSTLRQNLHIATNTPPTDMRSQIGIPLVQSPGSYSLPSPIVNGVPPIPRHKIVDITFDRVYYPRVDLTRHSDPGAVRRDIIFRLLPTASSCSKFDIFRTNPPGSTAALNDTELMLDVEHFGDDQGTLKFLVQVADIYSDSHLPTYAQGATVLPSLNPPHPIRFPSPSLPNPSPHSPRADLGEWHAPSAPAPDTRAFMHSPRASDGYPTHSPSVHISMPMPSPAPMRQLTELGAPEFPTPNYSLSCPPTPTFPAPAPENRVQPFVRRSAFINLSGLPIWPNNVAYKRSRHTSDDFGRETSGRSVVGCHDGRARTRPNSVVISGTMTTDEVLSHLYERGCRNVASELDEPRTSGDPVARGGGGDVYSGQLHTGQRVALKCIRLPVGNEARNKLKKTAHELYVWSKCNHPNVLELIGVTHHRGQVAMVSPWMDNGDLHNFLRSHPEANRHDLCVQIADGVAYMHNQTIVHGDIKGANVLISQDLVAKITDFGTSALKEYTLEFAATNTKPGLSIRWAAPEILEETSDNSYQADVYALAMTVLETITGEIPYANVTKDCAVIHRITNRILPVRPETHIPSNNHDFNLLWSLLNRCWAYEYWERPTAAEIQHQMRSIVF